MKYFKSLNPRKLFFGSLVSYVALRHLLPKKDMTFNKYNLDGDELIAHSIVNCLLFDEMERWYDGDICYPTHSYFWRRINFITNDNSNSISK